jgi:hypothetical protein
MADAAPSAPDTIRERDGVICAGSNVQSRAALLVGMCAQMEMRNMELREVYRITIFAPPDSLDVLLAGLEGVVPLRFGEYDSSAWWSAVGTEQFRPLPSAKPTVGVVGEVERVPTIRLEFAIPRDAALLERVLDEGVKPNHPWQEPAVFVDHCYATATRMIELG